MGESNRSASATLVVLLVATPLLAFAPAASAADPGLRVVNADTGASYATIRSALDAASPGDTITVPAGLDASAPAEYAEAITLSTAGVTLCATLAVATCLDHIEGGRWSTSTGSWGAPPIAWQGEAIHVGATGSTSHFPGTQDPTSAAILQVEDVVALGFDFLLASGSCTGGGLRAQIGLNSTGTGTTKDRTLFVFPAPSPCTLGAWRHHDLLAAGSWGLAQVGGPSTGGTQAQAQLLAGPSHRVVSFNAIFDAAPAGSEGWFDNVRFNDAVYREEIDGSCVDPQAPSCADADLAGGAILDAAGAATSTVRIAAPDVTLQGFTIRNTGATGSAQGVWISGANARIEGNVIEGNAGQALAGASQIGVMVSSPTYTIVGNTITQWAHTGVYTSLDAPGTATIEANAINLQGVNAILVEGGNAGASLTILGNDLRQARNANVRLNTSADVEIHENLLGVSQFTLDLFRFGYGGVAFDATRNHWGAFTRDDIEATIGDLDLASVDVSCYYLADGASMVCPPTADFTFAPAAAHIRQAIAFADASTSGGNDVVDWSWTFGDASTSDEQSPTHEYATSGVFSVTLTATDEEGFADEATRTIAISNAAPVLAAIGSQAASEGSPLTFAASASDPDGDALTYSIAGAPSGASIHPQTGVFSWTPTHAQAGSYSIAVSVTDGDLGASETVAIVVANVDRAPTIPPVGVPTLMAGATSSTNVLATDADGDAVTLAATSLPSFATFTDLGAGAGRIDWAPVFADAGTWSATLEASANGLTTTRTFAVTVTREAKIALVHVTPSRALVSPGPVTLQALVTNAGSETDTIRFTTTAPAPWGVQVPADVTLAPGASATVAVTFVEPANAAVRALQLRAASVATSSGARSVQWTIEQPVVVAVEPSEPSFALGEAITGVVRVTYLDGAPATGMAVQLTQTPLLPLPSSVSGTTNGQGVFAFDFGADLRAKLPGPHDLLARVAKPDVYTGSGTYAVE